MGQTNVKAALDLRDDADDIDGVESESFAEVDGIVEVAVLLAGVGFEKLDQGLADEGPRGTITTAVLQQRSCRPSCQRSAGGAAFCSSNPYS